MKSLFSFLILAIFTFQGIAQNSNLTIFSEDGMRFYLILNGIRQNENPETNVRVDGLWNDFYTAKLIFADQTIPSIEKKHLMVVDVDGQRGEFTYKIKANKKGEQVLRFFSFTPAELVLPPPASVAVISYNTAPMPAISFDTQITETITTTSTSGGNSENINIGISLDGINAGINVNVNDPSAHSHTQVRQTTTITTTNYNSNIVVVEEQGCEPMEGNLFHSALSSLKNKSFEDSKLSQAKEITQSNCLSAMQVKAICEIFNFESTRLEYAKFAYPYCFDQNNYWQINDSFDFESSISELNEYIQN